MAKIIKKMYKGGEEYIVPDTTYESKTAAQGGTDVSLVTTGEKYTWDNQVDNTAYGSGWNGDGTHAPSKDAVYNKIEAMSTDISGKQNALTLGDNLSWGQDGKLNATDTKYTAGTNISIDPNDNNKISTPSYIGGPGISVDNVNYVITNTQTSAEWGNITGTLADQTDLKNALDAKQDELTAGENVTIENVCYNDKQGPCPAGFHVPSSTEWTAVKTVWTTLGGGGTDGTNFGIALKLPFAGYRSPSTSNVSSQGSQGYYWSSSRFSANNAYNLSFTASSIGPGGNIGRSYGSPVRGFKDTPVVPDGTWTTLYPGTGGAGIFHNSSLGIISMSSDGTNWITIADKNVGAETYWTSGDTLSEANCGKYFQRGNNYGFDWTGTLADTSTTQVDASTYGPGNYYNSSTFIKYNGRWDSSDNGNLWGGNSQGTRCRLEISATGKVYSAGTGINIDQNDEISADTTVLATKTDLTSKANASDLNTKTFYLSSTSDLIAAQAAYDWYVAGKNSIISYDNETYLFESNSGTSLNFRKVRNGEVTQPSFTQSSKTNLAIRYDNLGVVTQISSTTSTTSDTKYLRTDINYSTPYTPKYNGSPTTKKYVDDNDTYIGTSAPTSNLVEGRLWYDTTNDKLKVYDGVSAWNPVDTNTSYSAGTGISISQNNEIAIDTTIVAQQSDLPTNVSDLNNDAGYIAGVEWGDITGTLADQTDLKNALDAKMEGMTILTYGTSTWANFTAARDANRIVYCKVSVSGGYRMAFLAYENTSSGQENAEFQYYRSRSSHNTDANQLDEVYIYKLDSSNNWTTTTRNIASKIAAGTGLSGTYNNSTLTIANDGVTSVNGSTGAVTISGGTGIDITNNTISVDSTIATKSDLANFAGFKVVATLPTTGIETNIIYLLGPVGSGADKYQEYIYSNNTWIFIGETSVDLTNYLNTSTQTSDAITEGSSKLFLTSEERTKLTNTTNTNSGDETKTSIQTKLGAASSSNDGYLTSTDWSTFNSKASAYNAGPGIAIGTYSDYSAMRGPCDEGFHIPTSQEASSLIDTGVTMGAWVNESGGRDNAQMYLKIPSRSFIDGETGSARGSDVKLWCSNKGYIMSATLGGYLSVSSYFEYTYASPIRPFKDVPVVPDGTASWTTLYAGTGSAGIFHNATLGIISLSSNGTTWITIADKNLGATQVWSSGDSVTDANGGKFYQWGNNYGFLPSVGYSTSSTQVDASTYGPGNYYSSSTFILSSSQWDSSDNRNLRGGVTGVVTTQNAITNTGVLSVNGENGDVIIEPGITKKFTLSGTGSSATVRAEAQAIIDWYDGGGIPIVECTINGNHGTYHVNARPSIGMILSRVSDVEITGTANYYNYASVHSLRINCSVLDGKTVQDVTYYHLEFDVVPSLPSSPDSNTIYFVTGS